MNDDIKKIADAAAEALKLAPDLYKDAAQPTAQESGKLLGRIPRLINAALAPLDVWILNKEYNIEETKKILAKKLEKIDSKKIVPPEPYVGVPALQAIAYSMNSEELRNMYANLLANSMNADQKDNVHPSFVEVVKQLSPFDAKLLRLLATIIKHVSFIKASYPIIKLRIQKSEHETQGLDIIKHIISPSFGVTNDNCSKYAISIDNLIRLNLITVTYESSLVKEKAYDEILNSDLIKELEPLLPTLNEDFPYIKITKGILKITDLGQSFMDICIE